MSQGGVPAAGVIEALDVLEDRCPDGLTVRPRVTVDQPRFKVETKLSAMELL